MRSLAAQTVSSAQDLYDYADEHFAWAATARTERERAIFLQMAAAWLEVAQKWETAAHISRASQFSPSASERGARLTRSPTNAGG
jgi:hypothetical protein